MAFLPCMDKEHGMDFHKDAHILGLSSFGRKGLDKLQLWHPHTRPLGDKTCGSNVD